MELESHPFPETYQKEVSSLLIPSFSSTLNFFEVRSYFILNISREIDVQRSPDRVQRSPDRRLSRAERKLVFVSSDIPILISASTIYHQNYSKTYL